MEVYSFSTRSRSTFAIVMKDAGSVNRGLELRAFEFSCFERANPAGEESCSVLYGSGGAGPGDVAGGDVCNEADGRIAPDLTEGTR